MRRLMFSEYILYGTKSSSVSKGDGNIKCALYGTISSPDVTWSLYLYFLEVHKDS